MSIKEKVIVEFEILTGLTYDENNNKHKLVVENMIEFRSNNGQRDFPKSIKDLLSKLTKKVKFL